MATYEQLLTSDPEWALSEGSRYFQGQGSVQEALRRIAQRLDELRIPYAVAGGMALFAHGYRRFTEDIDLLVTPASLDRIHRELGGRGYTAAFAGSKNLRDSELKVQIEFLVAGRFPGDGRPRPIAFPDPATVAIEFQGVKYVDLSTLVELKLASGMYGSDRLKDLADVQELIKVRGLGEDFSEQLDSSLRAKFRELWNGARPQHRRFLRTWPARGSATTVRMIAELITAAGDATGELARMQVDGVTIVAEYPAISDHVCLATSDPDVAARYDMHEETEFLRDRPPQ